MLGPKVTNEERERHAELLESIRQYDEPYTYEHCKRVGHIASLIASRMGKTKDECEIIRMAGEIHDVGKTKVDKSLLYKNGKYDDEEFHKVSSHAVKSTELLTKAGLTRQAFYDAAEEHHAHYEADKGGYGAKEYEFGEHPSEIAQIMAIADVYDALSSKRPYKDALPSDKVREILEENAQKGQFNNDIYLVFMSEVFENLESKRFLEQNKMKESADKSVDKMESLDESLAPREGAQGSKEDNITPHN